MINRFVFLRINNGNEYVQTFSEEELLNALNNKVVEYTMKVS